MADPFSNQPVLPGTNLQPVDIRPYQAGVSPAIAALEDALQKGVLDYNTLADQLELTPKIRRMKAAQATEATRASQARMDENVPALQAQNEASNINSNLQINPSRTGAAIMGNRAAASQAGLANVQVAGAAPGAELEAGEMQRDPTGMLSTTRKMWSQYSFGQQVPRSADGQIDYDKMRSQIQESFMPGSTADKSPHADEGVNAFRTMMLSQMWSSDYGKQVAAMAKEKNQESLMYDDKGRLQSPYVAGPQIGKSEIKPKLTSDQVVNAASKLPSEDASLSLIKEAKQLIAKPGVVGQEHVGGASTINQYTTEFLSGFGNKKAVEKDNDRTRLEQTLGNGILDSIRSLSGTGAGRVLGKEFEVMQKQTVPALNAGQEVWAKWLTEREDLIKRAQGINQQLAAGKLPAAAPAAAVAAPAAQNDANAGLPKVMSQVDYEGLKPGTKYVDSAGNVATKRAQ